MTKRHLSTTSRTADASPPAPMSPWPNGSGVFIHLPDGGRREIGRVVRDGDTWRLWWKSGQAYRPRGTAPTQSAAILLLNLSSKPAATAVRRTLADAVGDGRAKPPDGKPAAAARVRPRVAALAVRAAKITTSRRRRRA